MAVLKTRRKAQGKTEDRSQETEYRRKAKGKRIKDQGKDKT